MIIIVLLLSAITRLYRLNGVMPFIGDQAWFYLSARDLILTGNIPLVGITSSHTWLHQGPMWTYILALTHFLFGFDPIVGGIFSSILSILTVYLIYKFTYQMFSKNVALVASFIFALSPLVIIHARMPYHTSLIPLVTLLFIYSFSKWIKGEKKYSILTISSIFLLYNFQLATQVVWLILFVFLFYIHKNGKKIVNLFNVRYIGTSVFLSLLIMLPILVYDINHEFSQTIKLAIYPFYKMVVTQRENINFLSQVSLMLGFFDKYLSLYLFPLSKLITYPILGISILGFIKEYKNSKKSLHENSFLILISVIIPVLLFTLMGTPSEAYLPVLFIPFALFLSIGLTYLLKRSVLIYSFILLFTIGNLFFSSSNLETKMLYGPKIYTKKIIVDQIISLSSGKSYTIIGKGEGSHFNTYLLPYKYLLSIKGSQPTERSPETIFTIEEKGKSVKLNKK